MTDFIQILTMLENRSIKYHLESVEGEHPGISCPSRHPENYSTGVYFSFNEDSSLFGVHAYEPEPGEE